MRPPWKESPPGRRGSAFLMGSLFLIGGCSVGRSDPAPLAGQYGRTFEAEITKTVIEARDALNELFDELGAAHLQIGKKYHYSQQLQQPALTLLEAIKSSVDPKRLMNPKSLGLD